MLPAEHQRFSVKSDCTLAAAASRGCRLVLLKYPVCLTSDVQTCALSRSLYWKCPKYFEVISIRRYFSSGCIPWPCFELLGEENPEICRHYVQAPNDVTVESLHEPNPTSDTIVVSWKPSYYGMLMRLGYQVTSHVSLHVFSNQFLHAAVMRTHSMTLNWVAVWLVFKIPASFEIHLSPPM